MRTLRVAVLAAAVVGVVGCMAQLCQPLRWLATTLGWIAWHYVVTGARG